MTVPYVCMKCGRRMDYPDDHSTTAGCLAAYPITSGPTIWSSEEARKIIRYDEAIRLLREVTRQLGERQLTDDIEAFLAAETKGDTE